MIHHLDSHFSPVVVLGAVVDALVVGTLVVDVVDVVVLGIVVEVVFVVVVDALVVETVVDAVEVLKVVAAIIEAVVDAIGQTTFNINVVCPRQEHAQVLSAPSNIHVPVDALYASAAH
uniref:Uncharacterized protein n=1 Tax=Pristionchus pacificus TaxID=54126 RepID=A0A2A6C215_PRIPA|eukprot:PDM72176.1 hypothetical protein PRIPAC_38610 [Pristionchus pacificus]